MKCLNDKDGRFPVNSKTYAGRLVTLITSSLVHAVKERIIQNINPLRVVWFGPLAKSQPDGSDEIQMLVIVGNEHPLAPVRPFNRIMIAMELFRNRSFGLNLLVMTEEEINDIYRKNEGECNFIIEVMKEGKVIYDSARDTTHR